MKDLLKKFENKAPEIVFNWKDAETEAEGWTVINSLRGGAAGGGTRMRKGLDMNEVLSLAKTMEVKFSVSGPAIGGAKSGINFDPNDPRKKGVLQRWYKAVSPLLKSYYGTGGDLNVDEIHEVIPMTEECGVWHPQEGVFNGHFKPTEADKINRIGQLRQGVVKVIENPKFSPDVTRKYTVADMITGYGVAEAVRHYYSIYGGDIKGKKAIVQGFGNVGSAAAFYLADMGAKIIGIIDRDGGLINEEGFTFEEIKALFLAKDGNKLIAHQMIPFAEINEKIWTIGAEIFTPCAASRLVTQSQIDSLIANGLEVISCGANVPFGDKEIFFGPIMEANVPFADKEIFFGPIMEHVDHKVSLIPDFISNCGMARVFAYFMEKKVQMTDEAIFHDTSETIKRAIEKAHDLNPSKTNISATAFEIALKQLV
ncbi:NAD(P)-specific glutamate dehydrogenase [compost metagenome]